MEPLFPSRLPTLLELEVPNESNYHARAHYVGRTQKGIPTSGHRRVIFPNYRPKGGSSLSSSPGEEKHDMDKDATSQAKNGVASTSKAIASLSTSGPLHERPLHPVDNTKRANASLDSLLCLSPNKEVLKVDKATHPKKEVSVPQTSPKFLPFGTPNVVPSDASKLPDPKKRRPERSPTRRNILLPSNVLPFAEGPPKGNLKEVIPILRSSSSFSSRSKSSMGSVPSLTSLKDEEEESSQSSAEVTMPLTQQQQEHSMRRCSSDTSGHSKSIAFDPRIWVCEFERTPEEQEVTWYTEEDMDRFKRHALALVMAQNSLTHATIIPTGTTHILSRPSNVSTCKALFTHAALALDGEEDPIEALKNEKYRELVANNEIQKVLLVDPHDICLTLFTKTFRMLLPNVSIVTATSTKEALEYIATGHHFDIILVEERLKQLFHNQHQSNSLQTQSEVQSGSAFFRTLSRIPSTKDALFIGVSAHLDKDQKHLKEGGADLCWPKPPPKVSHDLRNALLNALLMKRKRDTIALELFGSL